MKESSIRSKYGEKIDGLFKKCSDLAQDRINRADDIQSYASSIVTMATKPEELFNTIRHIAQIIDYISFQEWFLAVNSASLIQAIKNMSDVYFNVFSKPEDMEEKLKALKGEIRKAKEVKLEVRDKIAQELQLWAKDREQREKMTKQYGAPDGVV
jgi:chromosome segregation ATPase